VVTVALIGADGAGKTSVARRLEQGTSLRVKYLYMGANPEAANHKLPTTRLIVKIKRLLGKETHAGGPPDPQRRKAPARNPLRRAVAALKSMLRLLNHVGEEWYRQVIAWRYRRSGYVVVFDRHFFPDHYAHDIGGSAGGHRPLARRIHGYLLRRFYPRPDLIIVLDAPAQVLFERKGEGTVELVERRRQEYFRLRGVVPHFVVVDANRPLDAVVQDVTDIIGAFREAKEASRAG
jgi:thymidylate kinase